MHNMSGFNVDRYHDNTDTTESQQADSTTEIISYSQQKYGDYASFIKHPDFKLFVMQYCSDLNQLVALACKDATFSERGVKMSVEKFKDHLFGNISPKNVIGRQKERFRIMAFGEMRDNLHCVLWHLNNDKNMMSDVRTKAINLLVSGIHDQSEKEITWAMQCLGVNRTNGLTQVDNAKRELVYAATNKLLEEEQTRRIDNDDALDEFEQENLLKLEQRLWHEVTEKYHIPLYTNFKPGYTITKINSTFLSTYHEKIKQAITDQKVYDFLTHKYHHYLFRIFNEYDAVFDNKEIKLSSIAMEEFEQLSCVLNREIRPGLIPFVGHDRFDVLDLVLASSSKGAVSILQLEFNINKVLAVGLIHLLYGTDGSEKHITRFMVNKERCNLSCDIDIVVASEFFSWLEVKSTPENTQVQLQLSTFKDLIWIRELKCSNTAKQHLLMQILADKACVNEEQLQENTAKIFKFILTFDCVNEFNDLCSKSVKLRLNGYIFPLKNHATSATLTPLISKLLINFIKKQCTPAGLEIMTALIECEIENEGNRYSKIKCSYEPFLDTLIQQKLLLNLPLSDVELGRMQILIQCHRKTLTTEGDWLTAVDWKKVTSPNREQILGMTVMNNHVVLFGTLLTEFSPNVSARFFWMRGENLYYTAYQSLLKLAFYNSEECFRLLLKQNDIDVNAYCDDKQRTLLHYIYDEAEFQELLLAIPQIDVFVVDSTNKIALLYLVEKFSINVLTDWFELQYSRLEGEKSAATREPSLGTESTEQVDIDETLQVVTDSKQPLDRALAKDSDRNITDSLSDSLKHLLKILIEHSAFENIYPALCEHFSHFKEEAESHSNAEILLTLWFNKNKEQVAAAYLYLHSLEQHNLNVLVVFNRIEGSKESQALVIKAKLKLGQRLDLDEQEYCYREFHFLVNKQYIPRVGGYFEDSSYAFILLCAIKYEQLEFVASLLTERKALRYLNICGPIYKLTKPTHFACTPLKFCLSIGCSEPMLKLFIELRKDDLFDKEDSILRVAIEHRDDLLHPLLDHVKKQTPERLIEFIEQRECESGGRTPLGVALFKANKQAAKHLVDFGADIFKASIIHLEVILGSDYVSEQLQKQAQEQQRKKFPSHFKTLSLYEQLRWLNVMRLRKQKLSEIKTLVDNVLRNFGAKNMALNRMAKQGCGLILRTHQRYDSNFSKQIKNEMKQCASNNKSNFEVIIKLLNKERVLD